MLILIEQSMRLFSGTSRRPIYAKPFEALLCFGSVHHVQVQETCQSRTGQPARRHNAREFPKVNLKYMSELSLVSANNSSHTHFLERNSSTNDR